MPIVAIIVIGWVRTSTGSHNCPPEVLFSLLTILLYKWSPKKKKKKGTHTCWGMWGAMLYSHNRLSSCAQGRQRCGGVGVALPSFDGIHDLACDGQIRGFAAVRVRILHHSRSFAALSLCFFLSVIHLASLLGWEGARKTMMVLFRHPTDVFLPCRGSWA